MARLNLVRVNQALAVEAEAAPVLRLPQKTLCIFEAIEHTIEGRNTGRAGGKHNQLERGRYRFARRVERQAQVRPKIVRPGNQPRRNARDLSGRQNSRGSLDHRERRLVHCLGDTVNEMRGNRSRNDDQIGFRSRDRIEVDRMPLRADAVDADRDRHSPLGSHRCKRRIARRDFVDRLHRVFQVEDDKVRSSLTRFFDRSRVGRGQEENRPHGEQVDVLVVFRFRYSHGRRIMPSLREVGGE